MPSIPPHSAVPTFYYVLFGVIEPIITLANLLEGIFYPRKMINRYTPWSNAIIGEADVLTPAVHALICQTAAAHGIIGFLSASVLRAARKLPSPTSQESIARALVISLAIGDILHLSGTFYGIGDVRWRIGDWPQGIWLVVTVGTALFIPRICWLLGIGRFVATRDSRLDRRN